MNEDNEPPLRVISPSIRSVVDSLDVNVKAIVASLLVEPLETVPDVIVIVGTDAS